jgi:hypothetical protein
MEASRCQQEVAAMLYRVLAYGEKIFDLNRELAALRDLRQKPQIAAVVFSKALLMLWLGRIPSFHALEQFGRKGAGRRFLRHEMPGADQLANISEQLDLGGLRATLGSMYQRLNRNKVLKAYRGHRLAVVDGHEINASYQRCCDKCQTRTITVNGQERIQYYHRAVILQLVGPDFRMLLDFELLGPHEDEGSAALRLIERVLHAYPRCFDILLGDGLYPQARLFKLLRHHGKHAIVVLKDQRRELLVDARSLFGVDPKHTITKNATTYQLWDLEEMNSWESFHEKVRVVRSIETKTLRERKNHVHHEYQQVSEWVWVTTLPSAEVSAETIVVFGHERWRIENEGFNELCNAWHADHYFHHHPTSITGMWLLLFMAHALFHCFLRNLKPCIRRNTPIILWAHLIRAEFLQPLLSSA